MPEHGKPLAMIWFARLTKHIARADCAGCVLFKSRWCSRVPGADVGDRFLGWKTS